MSNELTNKLTIEQIKVVYGVDLTKPEWKGVIWGVLDDDQKIGVKTDIEEWMIGAEHGDLLLVTEDGHRTNRNAGSVNYLGSIPDSINETFRNYYYRPLTDEERQ